MRGEFPYKAEFSQQLTLRNLSKHTRTAYLKDIQQFFDFTGEVTEPDEVLNTRMLRSFVRNLGDENLKAKSIHRKVSAVRTYARFLI